MDGENHSMTDWKTILAGADDEYLASLSNKGTVKRAHKDRETTPCEILDTGDQGINVKLGEEELRCWRKAGAAVRPDPYAGILCRLFWFLRICMKREKAG